MAAWGRLEFRTLLRKSHYTLTQRGAFLTLWCLAGLEDAAGRLKRRPAEAAVGSKMLAFLIAEGDVVEEGDELRIHGWSKYQEPLERIREQNRDRQRASRALSGAERTALWRERKRARDGDGDGDVTVTHSDVTLSSHSLIDSPSLTTDGEKNVSARSDVTLELARLIEQLTGRPWQYGPGSKTLETLRYDVRDFGRARVEQALRSVAGANGKVPDAAALVLGAHRLLVPIPDPKEARKREEADREQRDFDRRVEATRRRNAELRGGPVQ